MKKLIVVCVFCVSCGGCGDRWAPVNSCGGCADLRAANYEKQRIDDFYVYELKTSEGVDCVVSTASSQSMAMSCDWDSKRP